MIIFYNRINRGIKYEKRGLKEKKGKYSFCISLKDDKLP